MKSKKLLLAVSFFCLLFTVYSFSQGTWAAKAPLPAPGRWGAVSFTIGGKGYLGTGGATSSNLADFWEYDPIANTWTQKPNFGGAPRNGAVGFSIGNYGYIGTGYAGSGSIYNDFWKYDPMANTWTQLANVGGPTRTKAVGFAILGKGYIGTGTGIAGSNVFQDLWEYDPASNTWTQKANYVGGKRYEIDRAVFVICNKAYMGTGDGGGLVSFYNDFWEYDPLLNTWTQKTNFPGAPRCGATGFSIGSRGFLGLGEGSVAPYTYADFWKYNPFTNSWSVVTAFSGGARYDAPSFVINNKAYVGMGTSYSNDIWAFTPDSVVGNVTAAIVSSSNTICSGQLVTLSASGGSNYSWSNGSTNNLIVVLPTITTTYSVIVSDTTACGGSASAAVTISVTKVTASIACQNICGAGNNATLVASGGVNYLWSNGAVTSSITVSPVATTSYSVIVSTGACADTTNCMVNVFPAPVITTNGITDVTCNGGNDGSAVITVSGGTSPYMYNWSPSGGANAGATGLNAGIYLITVTDANGCRQVQAITITEPTFAQLAVPNAFSPNSDGENDVFCLQGDNYCIKELRIIIYDRWGEKVYESNDKNFCWDGMYQGKMMNSAVFVYYMKAALISGETITKRGNISLMR